MQTMKQRLLVLVSLGVGLPLLASAQQSTTSLADDAAHSELVITVGPVELPPMGAMDHMGHGGAMEGMGAHDEDHMVFPPIGEIEIPFDMYLHGFSYRLVDAQGRELPSGLLHHLNLITTKNRELFVPISQRLMAAGSETGAKTVPGDLIGVPVRRGERVVVAVMLHNPTQTTHHDVRLQLRLEYRNASMGAPTYSVFPFQIDVAFPAGDKSVDLPPGPASFSWEGRPAVPGEILVIGGHLHDHATGITLSDVTTGELLWTGDPQYKDGALVGVTMDVLDDESAIVLDPKHTYRVTARYDNPMPDTLVDGGMGVIAGVFLPDSGVVWPQADTTAFLYQVDRMHYLRKVRGRYDKIVEMIKEGKVEKPDRP